jgi:peroxiredoxin
MTFLSVYGWTRRLREAGRWRNRMLLALFTATALTSCAPKFESKPAPAVTFLTIDGRKLAVNELRGKVVLVNFWATTCAVCVKEMPRMIETYDKYKARGYEMVAVAMWYDPPNRVLDYSKSHALPFTVSFDPVGEIARAFGDVTLTPTTFVISKRGDIVARYVGEPDFARLHQLLEMRLAEAP